MTHDGSSWGWVWVEHRPRPRFPAGTEKVLLVPRLCQGPEVRIPTDCSSLILCPWNWAIFSFWPKTHPLVQNISSFPVCLFLFTPFSSGLSWGLVRAIIIQDRQASRTPRYLYPRMLKHAEKSTYMQDILGSIAVLVVYSKQHQCSSIKN